VNPSPSPRRPLHWTRDVDLGGEPPTTTRLVLDTYDWWHFRRLGAHVPELAKKLRQQPNLVPLAFDLYGLLYKPSPARRPGVHSMLSDALADELERTGALGSLRARTVLDEWATVTALSSLLDPLLDALAAQAESVDAAPPKDAIASACERAITRVAEMMETVEQVETLFRENDTWGRHRGALRELPLEELLRLGRLLREDRSVKDILETAGRWTITLKRRFPRGGSAKGRNEVRSVDLGGELERLLPSELVLLRHPLLRRVVLAKLVERRAMVTTMHGPKSLGRGPVIVVVDTSGSMGTERLKLAKSFSLALAMRCWETRRPFVMLTFGAPGELVETAFTSQDDFLKRLYGCLGMAFGGGTDFDGPLRRVCELATRKPWSQADAIFVTDGHCNVSPDIKQKLSRTKQATDLEVIGVLVGAGVGLDGIADVTYEIEEHAALFQSEETRLLKLLERVARRV